MYIPHVIYRLIIQFSTGFNISSNIYSDLERIIDVKRYIPQILFHEFVPCTDFFPQEFNASPIHFHLFKGNPYIHGRAYIPTHVLCKNNLINTELLLYVISLLKNDAIRAVQTRRFHMIKSALAINNHITNGTYKIIHYGKLFFLFSNPDNFLTENRLDDILIKRLSVETLSLRTLHLI